MQLLIIAPESDLDTHSEILDAVGTSNTKILHGVVSVRQVLDAIEGGQFDAIHFAGHGEEMRLHFADGHLDAALLADAIRKHGRVTLCLFNACESLGTALACYMAGSTYAIGWQDMVNDRVAVTFAFAFWASHKMSGDIGGAYRTGREAVLWGHPDNRLFPSLLNGRGQVVQEKMARMTNDVQFSRRVVWLIGATLAGIVLLDIYLHLPF
jgi:hypothetical protein